MTDTSEQVKDALLDAVAVLTRQRYTRIPPDDAEGLIRLYYERVAPQDLADKDPIDLYGAAVRHLQLAGQRAPAETLVQVYNPDIDEDGWSSGHTVIDVVSDDMPFIVDSVLALLEVQGRQVHVLVHPIAAVDRDEHGRVRGIEPSENGGAGLTESFLHLEIDRVASGASVERLRQDTLAVMRDVRVAVSDWMPMREQALALAYELEDWAVDSTPRFRADVGTDAAEVAALLRWMESGHFTFVGYREYDFRDDPDHPLIVSRPETGLGTMRQSEETTRRLDQLPPEITDQARRPNILNLTKANTVSTVHRAVPLDYIGIKEINADGRVTGERRFLGLFTSAVYSGRIEDIPVVRAKVAEVVRRSNFAPGSHDRSRLLNILQLHPRDELIQTGVDRLEETALDILDLRDRRQVSLLIRRDDFGRFLSCLVFVPRDRHSTGVRLEIERILMDAYQGRSSRFSTEISSDSLARIHFVIYTDPNTWEELPDLTAVQTRLTRAIRTWDDYLRAALISAHGEHHGLALVDRYGSAFSAAYRSNVYAEGAVSDIEHLEALEEGDLDVAMHRPLEAEETLLRCKLYRLGRPITLTQFIPLLHDLGAVVIDEIPYEVLVEGERPRFIYDIGIRLDQQLDQDGRARFREAILAVWSERAESDSFARLVTAAGLTWQDVTVLRAYARYLVQVGSHFSPAYVRETVNRNPRIVSLLLELFRLRFHPDDHDEVTASDKRSEIVDAIDQVPSLDADRILRSFLALVDATNRTNHWQRSDDGEPRPALAFKLDLSDVPDVPRPIPTAEIYVNCPRTEGVHLRSGRVARGGLRWSDRMEDYRTEILGLMKAQSVKNSVIVPAGAKGGFVARRLPEDGDRDAIAGEVVACYRTFIGALLDLTDNLVDGEVVGPDRVVRRDGDDPYLVVAADKGTASFSDIANEIAETRGFWLGDAFASGGSSGYDHKELAITSRGAWVSVRHHFAGMGLDVDRTEFSVAGVGDMSGDVFGNGMQRSRMIRLVAAFDHRHIFIDPTPDAVGPFDERRRLFEMPRSSWDDYDRSLISPGGGVFSRAAKSIEITDEMAEVLGIDSEVTEITPNGLIRAVLRSPVDLLWNGGIGTYVKASTETHAEVGDRSNETVRVDADELRCRVVGEGGNLGVTQRGRIEYAIAGGRINTDAIDNSGGVDCSDREVNLKILLSQAVAGGDLTRKHRDQLLDEMADEVCAQVLANNDAQNETLTAALVQAPEMVEAHQRLMAMLTERAGLDRELEALPTDAELAARQNADRGLARPELAVLLAFTKNLLAAELVDSPLASDPTYDGALLAYFPRQIRERYPDLAVAHPLRAELVATAVANQLVNRGGISMVHRLMGETSATVADIARAHTAATRIYDLDTVWSSIDALGPEVPADVRTRMQLDVKRLGERAARWLLRNEPQPIDIGAVVATYSAPVRELHDIVAGSEDAPALDSEAKVEELVDAGVPDALARRVEASGPAFGFLELSRVAARTGVDLRLVAAISGALDDQLELSWLRRQLTELPRTDYWEAMARGALRDEFFREHAALTAAVLDHAGGRLQAEKSVKDWLDANAVTADRCRQTFADIRASGIQDLARVSVAVRSLNQLARG